jgi:hypothetical protein
LVAEGYLRAIGGDSLRPIDALPVDHRVGLQEANHVLLDLTSESRVVNPNVRHVLDDGCPEPKLFDVIGDPSSDVLALPNVDRAFADVVEDIDPRLRRAIWLVVRIEVRQGADVLDNCVFLSEEYRLGRSRLAQALLELPARLGTRI